jgi:hypothetical protein
MNIEHFNLDKDLNLICEKALTYPEGIMDAHRILHSKLESKLDSKQDRFYFGISHPDFTGTIQYFAAAEENYPNEAKEYQCQEYILKKGTYISIEIKNYIQDIFQISSAFQLLLTNQDIDPQGCCVEMYLNQEDVRCMVKLKDNEVILF